MIDVRPADGVTIQVYQSNMTRLIEDLYRAAVLIT